MRWLKLKMYKFFKIFLAIIFIPGFSYAQDSNPTWLKYDESLLGGNADNAQHYILFDTVICNNDSLDNLVCFDYGWRNACLEIFAKFILSDDIPYILSEEALPVLKVGGFNKIDVNYMVEIEDITGPILPWGYHEEHVIWRVEVGSLETLLKTKTGIIYHLLNGDEMSIFFPLQNQTIMRSRVTLHGLKPLLEAVLEKAKAAKPVGQDCAG